MRTVKRRSDAACEQPRQQRGAQVADVEVGGGARSEASRGHRRHRRVRWRGERYRQVSDLQWLDADEQRAWRTLLRYSVLMLDRLDTELRTAHGVGPGRLRDPGAAVRGARPGPAHERAGQPGAGVAQPPDPSGRPTRERRARRPRAVPDRSPGHVRRAQRRGHAPPRGSGAHPCRGRPPLRDRAARPRHPSGDERPARAPPWPSSTRAASSPAATSAADRPGRPGRQAVAAPLDEPTTAGPAARAVRSHGPAPPEVEPRRRRRRAPIRRPGSTRSWVPRPDLGVEHGDEGDGPFEVRARIRLRQPACAAPAVVEESRPTERGGGHRLPDLRDEQTGRGLVAGSPSANPLSCTSRGRAVRMRCRRPCHGTSTQSTVSTHTSGHGRQVVAMNPSPISRLAPASRVRVAPLGSVSHIVESPNPRAGPRARASS